MKTEHKMSIWERYRQVFLAHDTTRGLDMDQLIEAWSQAWFLPDEVAFWLARGVLCPVQASRQRLQSIKRQREESEP